MDRKIIQKSDPFRQTGLQIDHTKTVYFGEVVSTDDPADGGRIKARVLGLDFQIPNENLVWSYPIVPKFFHHYPKKGEIVRILIADSKYPHKSRYWIGPVISQQQKIFYDDFYSSRSTEHGSVPPLKGISTFPDADGVFPKKDEIAVLGRKNSDVLIPENEVHLRVGKHVDGDVYKLNVKNPGNISLYFEQYENEYKSVAVIQGDKIALVTHDGNPKYGPTKTTQADREKLFESAHPMVRGDLLIEALNILRTAISLHIHPYSTLPADRNVIIKNLEEIVFDNLLQKNIVIN